MLRRSLYIGVFLSGLVPNAVVAGEKEPVDAGLARNEQSDVLDAELRRSDSLGRAFLAREMLDSAMTHFLRALDRAEELGETRAAATCYINVANVLILKGDLPNGIGYLERALKVHRANADSANIGACYNNLAAVHLQQDSLHRARAYLDSALRIHVARANDRGIAASEQNLGIVLSKLGRRIEAAGHFENALRVNKRMGDLPRVATTMGNLSLLNVEMGEHRNAISMGIRGIRLCDSLGIADAKRTMLESLVAGYEGIGKLDSAFHYLKAQLRLGDSLSTLESEQRILELERRYDSERKAAEIAVLQKDIGLQDARLAKNRVTTVALSVIALLAVVLLVILWRLFRLRSTTAAAIANKNIALELLNTELSSTAEKLKTSVATKDRFFTVLAHDLKGPIGTYRSISRNLETSLGELSKQQIQEQIQYLSRSSSHVHDLLENLLLWATSQTGGLSFSPREVDLQVLIHRSATIMEELATTRDVHIAVEAAEEVLAFCDANMILVVLNNLLSNAIRFSDSGTTVMVRCAAVGEFVQVEVVDQGVGIAESDRSKLFAIDTDRRAIGSSAQKGSGLGLVLCHEFVARNGGNLSVDSVLGKGSTFRFTLPATTPTNS